MRKHTISKYALGVAAAAMISVPTAGVAGAIPIIPSGASSAEPSPEAGSDSDANSGAISGVDDSDSDSASDSETSGKPSSGSTSGSGSTSSSGSTSGSGSNITSTVTTTTTPAPEDDEVTLDEPTQEDPAPAPSEEDLAVTGSSTQFFAGTIAVLAVLAAGGYVFAMRRASSV